MEHQGVKVQLLGTIETNNDGLSSSNFLSLATELAAPGQLVHSESYPLSLETLKNSTKAIEEKCSLTVLCQGHSFTKVKC